VCFGWKPQSKEKDLINGLWARTGSFILATGLSVQILLFPMFYTDISGKPDHGLLTLFLLGICIAYIHGVGFNPKPIGLAVLISPLISWPILIVGLTFALV
jgi:cyd operon protein YbgE